MTTQVLQRRLNFNFPAIAYKKQNPFLAALENIQYGRINIITPEGKTLEFSGPLQGPGADLRLGDWGVFDELIARGEIGFAENYIDKRCESRDLPALLTFALLNSPVLEKFFHGQPWYALWLRFNTWLSGNSLKGSRRNIMAHYDLGNDFYSLWLDKSMTYSCGLFEGDKNRTLEEAQEAKYQRILKKLAATPDDHILEIGCGWGGFAEAAAKRGCRVTAITISPEQANYAKERLQRSGLNRLASVQLTDYREITEQFDHIVSIGMFEHVGEKYWPGYFETIKKALKPGGTAMVQSITMDDKTFEELYGVTGFIEHYIFPGGMLPSKSRFNAAARKAGLKCREMFGFGQDYARTLHHWLSRFEAARDQVTSLGYDEQFLRLWRFYLASSIASFESKRTDVMQAEISH